MVKPSRAETVRESIMRDERLKVKPREKARRSQFDEVMKQRAQRVQQPALIQRAAAQAATEHAVRRIKHREEDRGRDRKGRDEGEKKEGRKGAEGDRKTDAKTAQERVVAKQSLKDEGRGGRGRGGGRGGFEGRRQAAATRSKLATGKQGPAMLKTQFASKLAAAMKQPGRAFTQHVLNQIVKSVRILANSDEEKEVRLELHEKIFRGLKLRVARKGKGRVAVHFATGDAKARELFMGDRETIAKALKRKGIEVDEISVT